jgi:acetyl esterase
VAPRRALDRAPRAGDGLTDVVHEDVEYARPDGVPLLARVYRPRDAGAACPALVDVHGGAWTYFDRTADAYFDRALAATGMVVVALDFRQGASHPWPTPVVDVIAGIRWTRTNAAALGARPDGLGLIGGSSGGHLVMMAALRPGAPDLRVAYALPLWPILDPLARYRYLLARRADPRPAHDPFFQPDRLIAAHDGFFHDEAAMHAASALRVVESGEAECLPPIWIAHPELDENVTLAMTERFVAAYRRAGGDAELEVFPGVGHAFANFPGEAADACIARMRRFIARRI